MSFAESVERQQEAVFRTLGEDAAWQGVAEPVRVMRREQDEEARFGQAVEVLTVREIRVRRSEIAAPAEGEAVQILDGEGNAVAGALYTVSGEPQLDRKGVWRCPATIA